MKGGEGECALPAYFFQASPSRKIPSERRCWRPWKPLVFLNRRRADQLNDVRVQGQREEGVGLRWGGGGAR